MQKIPERSKKALAGIADGEFVRTALIKPQKILPVSTSYLFLQLHHKTAY